jgi:hypothetical protein
MTEIKNFFNRIIEGTYSPSDEFLFTFLYFFSAITIIAIVYFIGISTNNKKQ